MKKEVVTKEMVRRAGKQLEFNQKHNLQTVIPERDFLGNLLPKFEPATKPHKLCMSKGNAK